MAESGAAGLSLRSVARELNITAPAIYNHFSSRDELVTALIDEAYDSLGQAQAAALQAAAPGEHAVRLRAVGRAYRDWALAYPERYQLIFGTPIPGYHCPPERVQRSAGFALSSLVRVIEEARQAGLLILPARFALENKKALAFEGWQRLAVEADYASFSLAILIWGRVHGLVSLELGGQLPPMGPDAGELYEAEIDAMARDFIKTEV